MEGITVNHEIQSYWDSFLKLSSKAGDSKLRPLTGTSCQISSGRRLEIKRAINVMHLNHPKP